MMTAESMLSKRPVLRTTAALFFLLKLFSSRIYCNPNFVLFLHRVKLHFFQTQVYCEWRDVKNVLKYFVKLVLQLNDERWLYIPYHALYEHLLLCRLLPKSWAHFHVEYFGNY